VVVSAVAVVVGLIMGKSVVSTGSKDLVASTASVVPAASVAVVVASAAAVVVAAAPPSPIVFVESTRGKSVVSIGSNVLVGMSAIEVAPAAFVAIDETATVFWFFPVVVASAAAPRPMVFVESTRGKLVVSIGSKVRVGMSAMEVSAAAVVSAAASFSVAVVLLLFFPVLLAVVVASAAAVVVVVAVMMGKSVVSIGSKDLVGSIASVVPAFSVVPALSVVPATFVVPVAAVDSDCAVVVASAVVVVVSAGAPAFRVFVEPTRGKLVVSIGSKTLVVGTAVSAPVAAVVVVVVEEAPSSPSADNSAHAKLIVLVKFPVRLLEST
jgi:hypothetical protein